MEIRKTKRILKAKPTMEGAGVHLKRAFGYYEVPQFDPFLMMDDFRNDDPRKYLRGFPWHPHRGIETITYMLDGSVEHRDSLGNTGILSAGDVQWMTAWGGPIVMNTREEVQQAFREAEIKQFLLDQNLTVHY